jgi:hypothetical protein
LREGNKKMKKKMETMAPFNPFPAGLNCAVLKARLGYIAHGLPRGLQGALKFVECSTKFL